MIQHLGIDKFCYQLRIFQLLLLFAIYKLENCDLLYYQSITDQHASSMLQIQPILELPFLISSNVLLMSKGIRAEEWSPNESVNNQRTCPSTAKVAASGAVLARSHVTEPNAWKQSRRASSQAAKRWCPSLGPSPSFWGAAAFGVCRPDTQHFSRDAPCGGLRSHK